MSCKLTRSSYKQTWSWFDKKIIKKKFKWFKNESTIAMSVLEIVINWSDSCTKLEYVKSN